MISESESSCPGFSLCGKQPGLCLRVPHHKLVSGDAVGPKDPCPLFLGKGKGGLDQEIPPQCPHTDPRLLAQGSLCVCSGSLVPQRTGRASAPRRPPLPSLPPARRRGTLVKGKQRQARKARLEGPGAV